VRDEDKLPVLEVAKLRELAASSPRTAPPGFFREHGVEADGVNKVLEGTRCVDAIVNGSSRSSSHDVGGAGDPRLVQHPAHGADQGRALFRDHRGGARAAASHRVAQARRIGRTLPQEYHS
jgi:hypothetical protein